MGEAWRDFEREDGDEKSQAEVQQLLPRRVKKRRKVQTEDGSDQGCEEYFDYIFPEDEAAKPNLKLLAMAKMWKKKKDVEPEEQDQDLAEKGTEDHSHIQENIDADDEDIVNESSDSEDESNHGSKKSEESSEDEVDSKRLKIE